MSLVKADPSSTSTEFGEHFNKKDEVASKLKEAEWDVMTELQLDKDFIADTAGHPDDEVLVAEVESVDQTKHETLSQNCKLYFNMRYNSGFKLVSGRDSRRIITN